MHRLHILKTGSTLPAIRAMRGDFEDWIVQGMGLSPHDVCVIDAQQCDALPCTTDVRAIVVTGSPSMVTAQEPWSVRLGHWLSQLALETKPILGICYGHQLLAKALGGEVGPNPTGREVGTTVVHLLPGHESDELLGFLPPRIAVHESHQEAVLRLPKGAVHLATNPASPYQAFRFQRTWGVQFHPEFDAEILRGYLHERHESLDAENLDFASLIGSVEDSPYGKQILQRFASLFAHDEPPTHV